MKKRIELNYEYQGCSTREERFNAGQQARLDFHRIVGRVRATTLILHASHTPVLYPSPPTFRLTPPPPLPLPRTSPRSPSFSASSGGRRISGTAATVDGQAPIGIEGRPDHSRRRHVQDQRHGAQTRVPARLRLQLWETSTLWPHSCLGYRGERNATRR